MIVDSGADHRVGDLQEQGAGRQEQDTHVAHDLPGQRARSWGARFMTLRGHAGHARCPGAFVGSTPQRNISVHSGGLSSVGMPTFIVRVWVPDRPGALGAVASRIGSVRGDLVGIDILERGGGRAIDELVVDLPDASLVPLLAHEMSEVDGVDVEDIRPTSAAGLDPRLDALETAASLVARSTVAELLEDLARRSSADFVADWAAVVDLVLPLAAGERRRHAPGGVAGGVCNREPGGRRPVSRLLTPAPKTWPGRIWSRPSWSRCSAAGAVRFAPGSDDSLPPWPGSWITVGWSSSIARPGSCTRAPCRPPPDRLTGGECSARSATRCQGPTSA